MGTISFCLSPMARRVCAKELDISAPHMPGVEDVVTGVKVVSAVIGKPTIVGAARAMVDTGFFMVFRSYLLISGSGWAIIRLTRSPSLGGFGCWPLARFTALQRAFSHATQKRREVVDFMNRAATSGRAFFSAVVSSREDVTAFQMTLYSPAPLGVLLSLAMVLLYIMRMIFCLFCILRMMDKWDII